MKKRILLFGGIALLVLVLAGAAFVGGRLLTGQGLPSLDAGGVHLSIGPGGKTGKSISLDVQPAKELPQTEADARGIFDHRQDNSLFIGTGKVSVMVQKGQNGQVTTSSNHSGPLVEVVVTTRTVVYQDVTLQQFNGQPPSGQKIQQVVQPGSLDQIGQSSMITAWGKKTGDRIIADVLVYTQPAFMTK